MKDVIRKSIKEERNRQGLNQSQLGMKAFDLGKGDENKAQKVISKIERGERDVTAVELFLISKILRKSVYYFLGKEESARSGTMSPHNELLDKADIVLTRGDRLSQVSLEKAILELYKAMEPPGTSTSEEPLIKGGGRAVRKVGSSM